MPTSSQRPHLAITPGDPLGIGPEITARALSTQMLDGIQVTLLGERHSIRAAFARWGDQGRLTDVQSLDEQPAAQLRLLDPHEGPLRDELPEITAIRAAVDGCLQGRFDAVVTGPINKDRLMDAGFEHPGHTPFLGQLTQTSRPVMAFVSQSLRVSLVTHHIPLGAVPGALTMEGIVETLRISHQTLVSRYGLSAPRIAVCGLNPHAGESGRLGTEELSIVGPAIEMARAEGMNVVGPIPSDSIFSMAIDGHFELIVALYHDQGLIPIKLLGRGASVHITMGLPIIRTSVDHGTAYNIAGQGMADPSGMVAAIREARRLVSGVATG